MLRMAELPSSSSVSSPDGDVYGDVTVAIMTTQHKVGIKYNTRSRDGRYYTPCVIKPYSLMTISTRCVNGTNGFVDRGTLKALDRAIAYHLGLSDEVPPYLMPEDGVAYSHITSAYSEPEGVPQESFEEEEIIDDCVEESLPPEITEEENFCDPEPSEVQDNFDVFVEEEDIFNKCPRILPYDKEEYMGISKGLDTLDEIIREFNLSKHDLIKIYRRDYNLDELCEMLNISQHYLNRIKSDFRDDLKSTLKGINKTLKGKISNFNKLDDIEKVALCCYLDYRNVKIDDVPALINKINEYRIRYGVHLSEKRKWRTYAKENDYITL